MATESLSPEGLALNSARLTFAEQVAFFRQKLGNTVTTEKWTDVIGAAHDRAVVVAGAGTADLIDDLAKAIDGFQTRGENMRDFASRFDDLVDKHGWNYTGDRDFRIRTIYQTNVATSYSAGRLVQLRRAADDGLLWMYKHSDLSVTPRPLHLAWSGLVLSPNDPWWLTHYPPNGWGCRCYVVAIHPANVTRLGGRLGPAPNNGSRTVTLGGKKLDVPNGIDPGWGYMPGGSVADELRAFMEQKAGKLPEKIGGDFLANSNKSASLPGGGLERWLKDPVGSWPLVRLPDADAKLIGAKNVVGSLSEETAKKQVARHPEMTAAEYAQAQSVVDSSTAKVQEGPRSMLYIRAESDGGHVLVVKATVTGEGTWVTSYRRLSSDEAKRDKEVARLLDKGNEKG